MYRLTLVLVVAGFCSLLSMSAQQDAQYTQYMYNTMSVNPGYTGSRGHMSIATLYRSQWAGLEGAPVTQSLNLHAPIGYKGVGLGLSVVNDRIGPSSETNFDIDFSYTLQTSEEGRISFGLKASAHLLDVRFSDLNQFTADASLENNIDNRLSPNIGAGIYYHTDRFYLGLSIPRILQTDHFDEAAQSTAQERMSSYIITGYVVNLKPYLKFKPTVLSKIVFGAPLQLDLSANFMLNNRFIIGAAYRWNAAISGLVGFNISDSLLVGVAYDRETTALGNVAFNNGSFEIILRYDFVNTKGGLKSPRFF